MVSHSNFVPFLFVMRLWWSTGDAGEITSNVITIIRGAGNETV